MEGNHSRGGRGNRKPHSSGRTYKSFIVSLKDFQNSKLPYTMPENYSELSKQDKITSWKKQIENLLEQNDKLCYQFPDKFSKEEVDLILAAVDLCEGKGELDYEYDSFFLGNKKQLLVYLKCREMDVFLEKYKLPKIYPPAIEKVQKIQEVIYHQKIQRNKAISFSDTEKVKKITQDIEEEEKKLQKEFKSFEKTMKQILLHFKSQTKRKQILLPEMRFGVFEWLRKFTQELELYTSTKTPENSLDEFMEVSIFKESVLPFEAQKDQQDGQQESDEYYSSEESSLDQEEELEEKAKTEQPAEISFVQILSVSGKSLILNVHLKKAPRFAPLEILSGYASNELQETKILKQSDKRIQIEVELKESNYFVQYLVTSNKSGKSKYFKFERNLYLNPDLSLPINRHLLVLGKSNHLIPEQNLQQKGELTEIKLKSSSISVSSSQFLALDSQQNVGEWGQLRADMDQEAKEVVEQNALFNVTKPKEQFVVRQPCLIPEINSKIVKVSCGKHYALLLDCEGKVWAYGSNSMKQLGIQTKSLDPSIPNKIEFFENYGVFIVDIKATEMGASFAISSDGTLYKWGCGQVNETVYPIKDSYGSTINFSMSNDLIVQETPIPLKKHYHGERIKKVCAGNEFCFALNTSGTLYGWGQCRNLGIKATLDENHEEIDSICNPVEIMKGVSDIKAGRDHAIAVMKDSTLKAWGSMSGFTKNKEEFAALPVDITEDYGTLEQGDILECGSDYTCLYKREKDELRIFTFGSRLFDQNTVSMPMKAHHIEASSNIIALLCE